MSRGYTIGMHRFDRSCRNSQSMVKLEAVKFVRRTEKMVRAASSLSRGGVGDTICCNEVAHVTHNTSP